MAKGTYAKEKIVEKIMNAFPDAFFYDKELRIPYMEEGQEVQIKVALTCAKTNVERSSNCAAITTDDFPPSVVAPITKETATMPTASEKQNVANLLAALGL